MNTDLDVLFLKLLNGKMTKIPKEVALLIKVGAGPEATSSNVTPILIDWYDLEDELIMVFERPKENIDLEAYLANRRTFVHEREVKVSEWQDNIYGSP